MTKVVMIEPVRTRDARHAAAAGGTQLPASEAAALCAAARGLAADQLFERVERSGLTGKGGGGFPTHRKMELMRAQQADRKFVIVNGSEHEPGSLKDRHLLDRYPHRVLGGALILARAVGATDLIIAVNETARAAIEGIRAEVARWRQSDDRLPVEVEVRTVPDIYIVGEETALIEALEGNEPRPRRRPPLTIVRGLHGCPTLVQNVETVAHLPYIVEHGPDAYRASGFGTGGVTLCTLGPEFLRPGVYEVPVGTPIREVLYELGGGLRDGSEIRAIQPGGPSSGFLDAANLDLPLDAAALAENGSSVGCAVIRAYSRNQCMVREMGRLMEFFKEGSCGQCPECRMETQMLDAIFRQLVSGRGSWKLVQRIPDILALAKGKGICGFIRMPVAPLETGLKLFHDDIDALIAPAVAA